MNDFYPDGEVPLSETKIGCFSNYMDRYVLLKFYKPSGFAKARKR